MAVGESSWDDGFRTEGHESGEPFLEHQERMRLFRASHPEWTPAGVIPFDVMVPYDVDCVPAEAGGFAVSADEHYWQTLIPLPGVTGKRFVFN